MARPSFKPDEIQRKNVEALASYGVAQEDIAKVVGVDEKTLRKHFRTELDTGTIKANARVAESLFIQAVGAPAQFDKDGNKVREAQERVPACGIFWMKTRAGWSEKVQHEHSGGLNVTDARQTLDRKLAGLAAATRATSVSEESNG